MLLALSGQATSQTANSSREALKALNKSYAIGRKFPSQERIGYLVELTRVSASVDPDSTRRWCEELFALASRSPLDWDHVASQKNAAVPLAAIDPMRAMELLAKVDAPQPDAAGHFPEDVRADAAAHIFPFFWRTYGLKKLAQIQFQARDIGDTGQYPYRAMAAIIKSLLDLNSDDARVQAEASFRDALRYYKRHSKFSNEEEEFLVLLQSAQQLDAADAYREGLELFIARVSVPGSSDLAFAANMQTAAGVVRVNDHNQQLLWRVLPLVMKFDPARGQKLVEARPELKQTEGGVVSLGATYIYGNHSPEDIAARQRLMLEKALLRRIASLNETDPQVAIQLARSLTTLPTRIIAFAIVLPSVMQSDPAQARELYDQQMRDLESVKDSEDRLKASTAIFKSSFAMQDLETLRARTKEAMAIGTRLFEKDSKKRFAQIRTGYLEMGELVEFAAQHQLDWVVESVEHTHVRLLKAHLLIFEAKGLEELRTTQTR